MAKTNLNFDSSKLLSLSGQCPYYSASKLADVLDVSLDYLSGKTYTELDYLR